MTEPIALWTTAARRARPRTDAARAALRVLESRRSRAGAAAAAGRGTRAVPAGPAAARRGRFEALGVPRRRATAVGPARRRGRVDRLPAPRRAGLGEVERTAARRDGGDGARRRIRTRWRCGASSRASRSSISDARSTRSPPFPELDGGRIAYAGFSLGAILGALYCPTDPRLRAAALALGGAGIGPPRLRPRRAHRRVRAAPAALRERDARRADPARRRRSAARRGARPEGDRLVRLRPQRPARRRTEDDVELPREAPRTSALNVVARLRVGEARDRASSADRGAARIAASFAASRFRRTTGSVFDARTLNHQSG